MIYEYEELAAKGSVCPKNLPLTDKIRFYALRGIYASLHAGVIHESAATVEKTRIISEIDEVSAAREAEWKRWEENQARTLAVDRALTKYQKSRRLEAADDLGACLEWLHDECSISAVKSEYGYQCPICGKFFSQDHADRKPTYCEDCGCRLGWEKYEH